MNHWGTRSKPRHESAFLFRRHRPKLPHGFSFADDEVEADSGLLLILEMFDDTTHHHGAFPSEVETNALNPGSSRKESQ